MGDVRRTIIVHIYDDTSKPNDLGFGMSGYGVHGDEIKCGKDRSGMSKKDPHKITFEINNRTSRNFLFPNDAKNAMWVGNDATTCPKTAPTAENPEFPWKDFNVSNDREQLSVKNLNSAEAQYKFSLNFVDADDPSGKSCRYDPIWTNQNGGSNVN